MISCAWRTVPVIVAVIALPSVIAGLEIALGSRVRLLSDEASFREAFSRFQTDEVNFLTPKKLERLGQEAEIVEVYNDATVTCRFEDGGHHDVPIEALSAPSFEAPVGKIELLHVAGQWQEFQSVTDIVLSQEQGGHVTLINELQQWSPAEGLVDSTAAGLRLRALGLSAVLDAGRLVWSNGRIWTRLSHGTNNNVHKYPKPSHKARGEDGADNLQPWQDDASFTPALNVTTPVQVDDPTAYLFRGQNMTEHPLLEVLPCETALGMESGGIADDQLDASSGTPADFGRLNGRYTLLYALTIIPLFKIGILDRL